MRLSFMCSLLLLAACSAEKSRVKVGLTSSAQLVEQMGQPQRVDEPATGVQSFVYPNESKFQVQEGVVVAEMREPVGEEVSLIYWRHQFRDCTTSFNSLGSSDDHSESLMELACPSMGLKIIYDENIERVIRVVHHAP